jgi:6-phosphogluconolactonase
MEKMVCVHKNLEDLNELAAANVIEILSIAIRREGYASFLLSGGSTPVGVYRILAQEQYRNSIPWDQISFFWGDERCVPPENKNSNYGQAFKVLLSNLPADPVKIHRIKGELGSTKAAEDYRSVLFDHAQAGNAWPIFDVALMGLGEDGHTASLFPGAFNPGEDRYPVIPVTANYLNRPAPRVSLTPLAFNTSRNVIYLVAGEAKAFALKTALSDQNDPENIPAHRIKPQSGNVIWHVDSGAGKYL